MEEEKKHPDGRQKDKIVEGGASEETETAEGTEKTMKEAEVAVEEEGWEETGKAEDAEQPDAEQEMDGQDNSEASSVSSAAYVSHQKKGARISGRLLYENEFTITWEIYKAFLKALLAQYSRIYYIIGGVCLATAAWILLSGSANSVIFLLCVAIISFALPSLTYGRSKKKKYAQLLQRNGGKPLEKKVRFYASGIEIFSDNGSHSVISYKDITKVISSKKLYILIVQKELSVLVVKDSFTVGELEKWKNFMITKGYDKIK